MKYTKCYDENLQELHAFADKNDRILERKRGLAILAAVRERKVDALF